MTDVKHGLGLDGYYIGWLRSHGIVWFRVELLAEEHFKAKLLQPIWRGDDQGLSTQRVFEDPRALATAVLTDTSWWAAVQSVQEAGAMPTSIRYDQLGWSTEQPWIEERLQR